MYTIYVCTTCKRREGEEIVDPTAGERLFEDFNNVIQASPLSQSVQVISHACLSGCKRACTVALTAPFKYSYVFGDLEPSDPPTLLELVHAYMDAPEGILKKNNRPEKLQKSVLARVPPLFSAKEGEVS